jgi:hypothetical protein
MDRRSIALGRKSDDDPRFGKVCRGVDYCPGLPNPLVLWIQDARDGHSGTHSARDALLPDVWPLFVQGGAEWSRSWIERLAAGEVISTQAIVDGARDQGFGTIDELDLAVLESHHNRAVEEQTADGRIRCVETALFNLRARSNQVDGPARFRFYEAGRSGGPVVNVETRPREPWMATSASGALAPSWDPRQLAGTVLKHLDVGEQHPWAVRVEELAADGSPLRRA